MDALARWVGLRLIEGLKHTAVWRQHKKLRYRRYLAELRGQALPKLVVCGCFALTVWPNYNATQSNGEALRVGIRSGVCSDCLYTELTKKNRTAWSSSPSSHRCARPRSSARCFFLYCSIINILSLDTNNRNVPVRRYYRGLKRVPAKEWHRSIYIHTCRQVYRHGGRGGDARRCYPTQHH